ncbi:MAG: hypothetical protein QXL47_04730 [Candidatus Anstonellales archaeon]
MKPKEFWSEMVTRKSFEKLLELTKDYPVVVIGGWAVYLWTKIHKSKDIALVVDYDTLLAMRGRYSVEKNERLKKYEIKMEGFDVDLYLPSYSKLAVPVEVILENVSSVEGIKVPSPEVLLILKQCAEIERRGSIKGKKDLIDIATLLMNCEFDVKKYRSILKKQKIEYFEDELFREINSLTDRDMVYLGVNLKEFTKWKRNFFEKFK